MKTPFSIPLAVCGKGAVMPAGLGIEALLSQAPWPQTQVSLISNPSKTVPAFRIEPQAPLFQKWRSEPRLRRASPLAFFMAEAAAQATAELSTEEKKRLGIAAAFSTGSIAYSRRFFQGALEQGQKFASPALFPETVFNSPLSHLASVLGAEGPCYALVGDDAAWVTALQTAGVWLATGQAEHVLVLGAEELDPISIEAYAAAGWFGKFGKNSGFVPSEGAGALLVRAPQPQDKVLISSMASGFAYRNPAQARKAAQDCMEAMDPKLPYYPTAQGTWLSGIEKEILGKRATMTSKVAYCGQAFTASAAWNTIRALSISELSEPQAQGLVPIWGLNHQVAALEMVL